MTCSLPKPEKKLPIVLTLSQMEQLLEMPQKIDPDARRPAVAGITRHGHHGAFLLKWLRVSELVALDVRDADFLSETLRVMGKGNKERMVPIGSQAMQAIQKYRSEAQVHDGPLFINKNKDPKSAGFLRGLCRCCSKNTWQPLILALR